MKVIKAKDLQSCANVSEERARARFFNTLSGVKSAFLVGTQDENKRENLAIFSSLFHLGANPPLMGFVLRPTSVDRHTYDNIVETKCFSLNCPPFGFAANAHLSSARFKKEESEFDHCEFKSEQRGELPCPHVAESPISWTMKLVRIIDVKENGTHIIIGSVEEVFLKDELLGEDQGVQYGKADPLLCVGLDQYLRLSQESVQFPYAKAHMSVDELKGEL